MTFSGDTFHVPITTRQPLPISRPSYMKTYEQDHASHAEWIMQRGGPFTDTTLPHAQHP